MQIKKTYGIALTCLAFFLAAILVIQPVIAATLTTIYDRLNTITKDTATGVEHNIIFTPTGTVSGATDSVLMLQFPDGDDGKWCRTAGDLTATATTEDSATGLPGTLTGSCTAGSGASSYDTFLICATGSNTWTADTKYGVKITGDTAALGTKAAAGNDIKVTVTTGTADSCAAPTPVDTGYYALSIIDSDQVAVTATVDPLFTFSIDDLAIGFGNFSSTDKRYATGDATGSASEAGNGDPAVVTVTTNAPNGAMVSAKSTGSGAAAGLYKSVAPTRLIPAAASSAVVNGTEGYGLYVKNKGDNLTITEGFNNDTVSDVAISNSFQTIITASGALSTENTADVALVAAISGATTAGSYSDTITLVGTGKF